MDIPAAIEEMATALGAIDGLRVYAYWPDTVTPPTAVVPLPDAVEYDETYGRGSDSATVPVMVLIGKVADRLVPAALGPYLSGSGDQSVKAALEGGTYTELHVLRVARAEVTAITWGAVDYLGAMFTVEIIGPGS